MKEKIKMILFLLLGISGLISVFFSSEIAVSQQSNIKTNISTTQVACATDFFQQEINDLFPNYTLYYLDFTFLIGKRVENLVARGENYPIPEIAKGSEALWLQGF